MALQPACSLPEDRFWFCPGSSPTKIRPARHIYILCRWDNNVFQNGPCARSRSCITSWSPGSCPAASTRTVCSVASLQRRIGSPGGSRHPDLRVWGAAGPRNPPPWPNLQKGGLGGPAGNPRTLGLGGREPPKEPNPTYLTHRLAIPVDPLTSPPPPAERRWGCHRAAGIFLY